MSAEPTLLERLQALQQLLKYITPSDIRSLKQHCLDDSDVVGALVSLLYDAEVGDPEGLLEKCGILEGDDMEENNVAS